MACAVERCWPIPPRAMLRVFSGLLFALLWAAWAGAVELSTESGRFDLTPHLSYASGTSATPEKMAVEYRAGRFGPELTLARFEADHAAEAWAAVPLSADTAQVGRILFDIPLASEVDAYFVQSGEPESILSYSLFRPFMREDHAAGRLQSEAVELAPGVPVLLLVHVKFGPLQSVKIAFETPEATAAQALKDASGQAGFYAFVLASLLIFLALFAAIGDRIGLLYALLFSTGLLFLAFIDGLLFRFLYPGLPEIQSLVGFFLIFALSGSGFVLAAHGFTTAGRSRAARVVQGFALACLAGFVASLISPGPYVGAVANLLLALMPIAVLLGTRAWEAARLPSQRLGGWMGAISGLAIALLVLFPLISPEISLDIVGTIRAVYLVLLAASLINFTAQVVLLRRERAEAVAAELSALQTQADLSRELFEAERNYGRARELAQMRRRQLATASHDLRQPLMSLRMNVDSLASKIDPESRARLAEAFDYISELSGSYLDAATGPEDMNAAPDEERTEEAEAYPVSMVLQTVWQMFHEEARAKGLRLRVVPSGVETNVPALVLMRITSNLVANAIKHGERGGVVAGIRRRAGRAVLTVCDTGPGMTEAEIAAFREEGAKGADSEGHGLGLAVCYTLARAHGLSLDIRSEPGRGSCFALTLPALD